MKNLILTVFTVFLLLISCDSGTVGKYKKEPLPDSFSYNIIEDNSNIALEKNQLTLEINQKLTEGQIATLAEKLFNSKEKQRRFYIFYQLSGMKNVSGAWAISHFDPELDIQILGSTSEQDENANKISEQEIDGEIIGKWREEQYTSSNYIIYKKDNKTFLKTIFKNGQTSEEELSEQKVQNGLKYVYKEGGYNGEYFVLNSIGDLEFYNNENKNFTTALKTN
ncbi:MAG: hypothetical protein ACOCUL_03100 [Bacteroidota bacterium]